MAEVIKGNLPDTLPTLEDILETLRKQAQDSTDLLIEKLDEVISALKEITNR